MITRISGKLVSIRDAEARIEVGAFEYQVYIPEFVRRQLQPLMSEQVQLQTIEFLEGNPQQGRLTPRIIGFLSDAEKEFFELVCSVDGVGVKKALRAMVRPVSEVATAIEEQDVKQLSTLPGIGPAVGERIVAKLRRKMSKFALIVDEQFSAEDAGKSDLVNDACEALLALGHTQQDARQKIELALEAGKKPKTVEDLLTAIYQLERIASTSQN